MLRFLKVQFGLNGDILVCGTRCWRMRSRSLDGIRVDAEALKRQLALTGDEDRLKLEWHQALLRRDAADYRRRHWPVSFDDAVAAADHIGQVQCGVWPAQVRSVRAAVTISAASVAAGGYRSPVSKRQI